MFTPVERSTASSSAAEMLQARILDGELAPGARLPPERELANQLGVSRLTLRPALARLAAMGLLTVRHGSGYVVRDFREHGGPDLIGALVDRARTRGVDGVVDAAADLLLVRRHLARAVLERLASASHVDTSGIRAAIAQFASAVDGSAPTAELAALDLAIAARLVEATGSTVLQLSLNPIAAVMATFSELRDAMYARPADNVVAYGALLAWLELRLAETAPLIATLLAERDLGTIERLGPPRPKDSNKSPRVGKQGKAAK